MLKLDWRCPTCGFINDKSQERPNCWNCAQNFRCYCGQKAVERIFITKKRLVCSKTASLIEYCPDIKIPYKEPEKQSTPSISKTLEEHESSHGSFQKNADLFAWYTNNTTFTEANITPIQRLALTMIFLKISRILNGDNNFLDHWHDICGYATLAKKEIQP